MQLTQNHIFFTASHKLAEICKPLFDCFSIVYFDYTRNYYDNSHIFLNTHSTAMRYVLENDYHLKALNFKHPAKYEYEQILWDECDERYSGFELGENIRELFDIAHGFVLIEKHKNYTEVFNFATRFSHAAANTMYLSHFSQFKYFTQYFKEKAELLLQEAEKQKFYSPYSTSFMDVSDDILIQNKQKKLNVFFKEACIKKDDFAKNFPGITLTDKEMECIQPLLAGYSYKQIAKLLHISPRTIEDRVEQLRYKLNCTKKKELLAALSSFVSSPDLI